MSWLSKIFGGKKEEVKPAEQATEPAAPAASEIPMTGVMPEEKEEGGEEAAAGSEEMK